MLQNTLMEHSAVLLTCIKLRYDFKTFVLSIFEWPLKTVSLYELLPGGLLEALSYTGLLIFYASVRACSH